MTLFRFTFLSLLATGCFAATTETGGSSSDTDTDSDSDTDTDSDSDSDTDTDTDTDADTGTAYLINMGGLEYDKNGDSLSLHFGFGLKNLATEEIVCSLEAQYESVGAGPSGCPECDYSFTTEVTGGGNEGAYCDALNADSIVNYGYTDFWMGNGDINGWGWSEAYTYSYAGTDYDLTQSIFLHYEAGTYNDWYLRAYNFPDAGVYSVEGDMNSATWESYSGGSPTYYYYFYY